MADGERVVRRHTGRTIGCWERKVSEYLAFRRDLGFALQSSGYELRLFARHLDAIGHREPLTADMAIDWARRGRRARREYGAARLVAIRGFAKYLAGTDPRHEVPAAGALGRAYRRGHPHIYSSAEVIALLNATMAIKPAYALPRHTFRVFFGLLAATGLRCGEALALRRDDVDLVRGRLTIICGKPGRDRIVPMHDSVVRELKAYATRRDHLFARGLKSDAFFVSRRATRLKYQSVTVSFRRLRRQVGWHTRPLPRVHDLRHTFAVRVLLRWCAAGEDIDKKILALTTYLGHVNVTSTYWYFSAVPELMAMAGRRFERFARLGAAP